MDAEPDNSTQRPPRSFRTTHWSLISAASADSRAAMEELAAAYWPPLHWHLRRLGYSTTEAEDLTQAFFARLLEKRLLDYADARRGRFRTFLLTALRRFVINEWKQETAVKRGGNSSRLTFRMGDQESLAEVAGANDITPDQHFERQWAILILQRAFQELAAEQTTPADRAEFAAMVPFLTRDTCNTNYKELAKQLQSTPGALRMSVSRMRSRLRELVRAEIRKTVQTDEDVDDEVRALFLAFQA